MSTTYIVHVYPDPTEPVPAFCYSDVFEVLCVEQDIEVASDCEVRRHPEVPLAETERDSVLQRLHYRRCGPWYEEKEGTAQAKVVPCPPSVTNPTTA